MDETLDTLLWAEMIKEVSLAEGGGKFLFEAFLVPKSRDSTGHLNC